MLEELSQLNLWIADHKELLTLLGIPALTFMVTRLANRGIEKRAAAERQVEGQLAREIKLADFRQQWITKLREEFSQVLAISSADKKNQDVLRAANARIVSILLRMNPEEESAQNVYDLLLKAINFKGNTEEETALHLIAASQMNSLLKAEWERLKNDLQPSEEVQSR